jgi:hypothetical protein
LPVRQFLKAMSLIEISKESRRVVGNKIAIARTKDLVEYLKSYGTDINPAVKIFLLLFYVI